MSSTTLNTSSSAQKLLVITLMGPTASGKTALAMALVHELNADIISVDSAMVYRGLNIGAAKPTAEELQQAPHRLIDIRDPDQPYSAADFCRDAKREIADIHAAGKIPLLVGGTMLYFKALFEGLSDLPEAHPEIRAEIETLALEKGWPHIHELLAAVDPISAERIHPNHSQRLSRALEVYRITGKPLSSFHGTLVGGIAPDYHCIHFAISTPERKELHERIAKRFDLMLSENFIAEVEGLIQQPNIHPDLPAMRAVGYRQVWEYLRGECSFDDMREQGIVATRRLAKRQLTWLRSWSDIHWLTTDNGHNHANEQNIQDVLKLLAKRAI